MALDLTSLSSLTGIPTWLMVILIAWTFAWKGVALWISARKNQPIWFILILVVNLVGILEILYIFLFSKIDLEQKDSKKPLKNTKAKKKR